MALFGPPDIPKLTAKGNVKGLIKALSYRKDAAVRRAAASALGEMGDRLATLPLLDAVLDDSPAVGEASAEALRALGPVAVAGVAGALKSPDPTVRERVARALVGVGGAWAVEVLMRIHCLRYQDEASQEVQWALAALGPEAVEPLIAHLQDRRIYARLLAVQTLGDLRDERAIEPLIGALDHERETQTAAADALVRFGAPAVQPLVAVLDSWPHGPTDQAAEILGRIGDRRAVEPLIRLIQRGNQYCTRIAAVALGRLGDARAVPELVHLLGKSSGWAEAATALGQIGDAAAAGPLIEALSIREKRWCLKKERHATASALVSLYQCGALPAETQHQILELRPAIMAPHRDTHYSSDCTPHQDQGIGVAFPI